MLNIKGLTERHLHLFDEAIESYKKAINIKPNHADPYNNLAIIYRYFGKKELAIENFRKAISIKNDYCSAFYNLSCIKGYKASSEEIANLEALIKKLKNRGELERCYFALYNAYVSIGEQQKAFNYLEAGNNLHYKNIPKRKPLSYFVDNIKKYFDLEFYKNRIQLKPFYKTPYFIVGMP